MPILPKTFNRGLELVSDEKQQSYLTRGITDFFEYKAYVCVDSWAQFLLSLNARWTSLFQPSK